ncbi:DUF4376 domain-containing protein [Actinobacillus suis]|uniref:DUF4376 domain-containing protein n=1 Tax=Actinobacillus suis TaxID=716 RepID=UPI000E31A62F|nr:DUF4376 domain-containing protein [Actinobacillus suis]
MTYFYNLQYKTFLVDGIHSIPEGAIAVSETDYQHLINGRAKGREIVLMGDTLTLTSPRPSDYHTLQGYEWVISDDMLAAQRKAQIDQVRTQINALRDTKINGGVYVSEIDKWIDSDATAERNLLSVKATFDLIDNLPPIAWTCADNSQILLDKQTLLVIWQALLTAKTSNHANALKHKEALAQSTNPLEYDYSDGWTDNYQEAK